MQLHVEFKENPLSNPVDSHAIAFECRVNDQWERIGYVLHVA